MPASCRRPVTSCISDPAVPDIRRLTKARMSSFSAAMPTARVSRLANVGSTFRADNRFTRHRINGHDRKRHSSRVARNPAANRRLPCEFARRRDDSWRWHYEFAVANAVRVGKADDEERHLRWREAVSRVTELRSEEPYDVVSVRSLPLVHGSGGAVTNVPQFRVAFQNAANPHAIEAHALTPRRQDTWGNRATWISSRGTSVALGRPRYAATLETRRQSRSRVFARGERARRTPCRS